MQYRMKEDEREEYERSTRRNTEETMGKGVDGDIDRRAARSLERDRAKIMARNTERDM
jgi:O-acetyl-ADP-ribose deacetylase (regulator of RNase III)